MSVIHFNKTFYNKVNNNFIQLLKQVCYYRNSIKY